MTNHAVVLQNISKQFHQNSILEKLNFSIDYHKITTVFGPSGSGKTTLLNIIGLLDKPSMGSLELFDKPAPRIGTKDARLLMQQRISYLFQNFALINEKSIQKNLELVRKQTGESKTSFNQRKSSLFSSLNLRMSDKTIVGSLSGGEQQRVALTRCLLKPCDLILCDEPTGSLDPTNKLQIFAALQLAKHQGKTILIVSHDPDIIRNSDKAIDIRDLMQ